MSDRDQLELLLEAAFRAGSFDQAEQSARAAERSALRQGRHGAVASARVQLGMIRHYESILRRGRSPGRGDDSEGMGVGGTDAAAADAAAADASAAEEEAFFRSALALSEAVADKACAAAALLGIGLVEQVTRRDWNEAMPYYRCAEALIPELRAAGDEYTEAEIHRRLGLYFVMADARPERALHHLGTAHAILVRTGDERLIPRSLTALSAAHRARGAYGRAVALAEDAVQGAREARLGPLWIAQAERALHAARVARAALIDAPASPRPPMP